MKNRIRIWVYKLIGYPTDVQNLLNHLDEIGNVCIYPAGEFTFGMKTPEGQHVPYTFDTPQERAAFGVGLEQGVYFCGGSTTFLTEDQLDEIDSMDEKSTHFGNPKKVN